MLIVSMLALLAPMVPASAQTQIVTASPGYVNLGMTVTITVTAPAAGTYSVIVDKPGGASTSLNFVFTSAGQKENQTYGSTSTGFGSLISQVGTYTVFVTQGGQTVGTTSFYATNQINIGMDMVTGGTCTYIGGAPRGTKMFPRFYLTYASNGQVLNNNTVGILVQYTVPGSTTPLTAGWDAGAHLYVGKVQMTWNYTFLGPWSPTATVTDAAGNTGTFTYAGAPFTLSPAAFATNIQFLDATSNLPVATLYNGETVNIHATVTYPTNAEPVSGFVAPLDSTARGGVVTAYVGWGTWNASALTFGGSAKSPGALVATVKMAYTGANGTWTGQFVASSLPTLPAGQNYAVAVVSSDKASPPNTGLQLASLSPAPTPAIGGTTTVTATTTVSAAGTGTATGTATATTTVTGAPSTITSTISQISQSIPTIAYAGMALLLIIGLAIGMILRMPKRA